MILSAECSPHPVTAPSSSGHIHVAPSHLARAGLAMPPVWGEPVDLTWGREDWLGVGGRGGLCVCGGRVATSACVAVADGGGGMGVALGSPSPATIFETQFIEFIVKVLWAFPGSFSLWKLLCWQFGGWCLACLGEVESGPVLLESSSARVTQGKQAGGLSVSARFLQLGPEWTSTCFLPVHPLGVPNLFSGAAVVQSHPSYQGHFH